MIKSDKIYLAGHTGLVGSAIMKRLLHDGYDNIVTRTHAELDLCDKDEVKRFFENEKPAYVFFAAAKVGGVFANNTYRADFIYENIVMESTIIHNSFLYEVKKLLFLSSADCYPTNFKKPIKEKDLLTGPLEPTCEPYALAKVAGMKMCESYNRQYGTDFVVLIAPNVYGPHQKYDALNAQVIPSLIKRFDEAKKTKRKEVVIWGSGTPIRDFLYVDDLVDACLFAMNHYTGSDFINVGTGTGFTIRKLAGAIKKVTGFKGDIRFDRSKPDGVKKKLLDITRIKKMGWKPKTRLVDGLKKAYASYLDELDANEARVNKIVDIHSGTKDRITLKRLQEASKQVSRFAQPQNYQNIVVEKPWGYEFLAFENSETAIWFLYLKKGQSTSMHCHPLKKTSLIILSGNAVSNTFSHKTYLQAGDALVIDKCVFHTTKVLSDNGVCMLEIENPPNKTDLVRFEDRYGREKTGYEGKTKMVRTHLDTYNHFYLSDADSAKNNRFVAADYAVSLEVYENNDIFNNAFLPETSGLYTCCKGKLYGRNNEVVLNVGDTQKADVLFNYGKLLIKEKTVLLKTLVNEK